MQRQEDLPAWKFRREPVRDVNRQGGLADSGHAADGVNAEYATGAG
jgi:hypothetical protein